MPRQHVRKTTRGLIDILLYKKAYDNVKNGESLRKSARKYGVNHVSLSRYIRKREKAEEEAEKAAKEKKDGKEKKEINIKMGYVGNNKVFNESQENELAEYCFRCADTYFGYIPSREVRKKAYELAVKYNASQPPNWSKNKMAGEEWYRSFLKRNPEVSALAAQHTSISKASRLSMNNVDTFYDNLKIDVDPKLFSLQNDDKINETGKQACNVQNFVNGSQQIETLFLVESVKEEMREEQEEEKADKEKEIEKENEKNVEGKELRKRRLQPKRMQRNIAKNVTRGQNGLLLYNKAYDNVKSGVSPRKAALKYGLNYVSLIRYICKRDKSNEEEEKASNEKNDEKEKRVTNTSTERVGDNKVFNESQESELAEYCFRCIDTYFSQIFPKEVKKMAYELTMKHNLSRPPNWSENKMAGEEWFRAFLKRHPQVSARVTQPTTVPESSSLSVNNIDTFYDNLQLDIDSDFFGLQDTYNMDETDKEALTVEKPVNGSEQIETLFLDDNVKKEEIEIEEEKIEDYS